MSAPRSLAGLPAHHAARALSRAAPPDARPCCPACSFIVFLAIYSGIVNNPNLSRFVRYNVRRGSCAS